MSSTSTDVRKRCGNCSEYVKIYEYITCFKCDATYHIYCWKKVPGAYVDHKGQLFCCSNLTSNYATTDTNLGTQDNPADSVIEKGNVDSFNEDLKNCLIKKEDSKWNEFKCDTYHLEFTNKEHIKNHYSECPNKEEGYIRKLKEDKDLENCQIKEEASEWNEFECDACPLEFTNKEHIENRYSECHNKEGGYIQELNENKDLENCLHKEEDLEWSEFRCGTCLLEFTNEEHLKNHYSECPNKEGELIQVLTEDKDVENRLPKEENSEPNEEYLENYCSESPNKQGGSVPDFNMNKAGLFCSFCNEEDFQKESYEQHIKRCHVESSYSRLNKDSSICITNTKKNPVQVDGKEKKCKRTVCYSTHIKECVAKRICIPSNERSFKCDMCSYTDKESEMLKSRLSSKLSVRKAKYDSRVCAFSTPSKNALGSHQQICTSKRLFQCDLCDYTAAQRINLKIHIESKHSNADKTYRCRDCEYSTYRKRNLVDHIRTHTNEKPFKCDMCDYAAALKPTLKKHVLAKHSNADKEYKCRDCEYSAHRKEHLVRHVRTHANEKQKPFKCDVCDYAAAQKENLNVHILAKHSNADKGYKCTGCEYSTHRKEHLVRHMYTHTNEKPFKCDMCDYTTVQKCTLDDHLLAKHSNEDKGYKCTDCEYSTYRRRDLVRHTRIHTNDKPFKCDMCDYAAAEKRSLDDHILAKHSTADRRYKCRDCKYSTYRNKYLVKHMRIHTNERPFKCAMCAYAAAQKRTLRDHILAKHSNADKKYKCKKCEYSSYTKWNLLQHEYTHTNEKPFKCDKCEYAAARKRTLNLHILVKHSNIPLI